MHRSTFIFFLILTLLTRESIAKGGRLGGRYGGGGKSGGSRNGGNKNSQPNQSKTSNTNQQIGWNTQINNSPNGNSNPPIGPPPAYPGLQNQPVLNDFKPPPYSPSSNFPPPIYSPNNHLHQPYSPAKPNFFGGSSNNFKNPNYGSTFGGNGLAGNTYISNNYYRGSPSSFGFSGLLTNALFFGGGLHTAGYLFGRRKWNDDDDRKWRATTKAPYFENKVPGSEVILPASAVVGAATAFGLASLLPLNVPSNKPLMYCDKNSSEISQAKILINGNVYQCINETIYVNCLKLEANESTTEAQDASISISDCDGGKKIMECGTADNIYCTNGTLLSRFDIFCNSTANFDKDIMLKCYEGQLAARQTAFIPTTSERPPTTTEKSISLPARMHMFFLNLIGKEDILEKAEITTTTSMPDKDQWIPEALTIPPSINEVSQNLTEKNEE